MTISHPFNLSVIHDSWQECIARGLAQLDPAYVKQLSLDTEWLPGPDKIFNAFSIPMDSVNFVLFGESPYPRPQSANGYAFWDAAVKEIWSPTGLSKPVNRATSLRHLIKMLLIAEGVLENTDTSQPAIANVDKKKFVHTGEELFRNFIKAGFLLMNTTLVLHALYPQHDAKAWRPFVAEVLHCLVEKRPHIQFILLGKIANTINPLIKDVHIKRTYAEHPYNISFIHNPKILDFFRPLHLILR